MSRHTYLSITIFVVSSALCFAFIEAGLIYAPPLRFAGLRALLGGAALFLPALARREPLLPSASTRGALVVLALTSTTIAFAAMFLSPGRAPTALASVLGNAQPLFTIVIAGVVLHEPVTRAKGLALVVGLVGILLLTFPSLVEAPTDVVGALLALGASASSAVGSTLYKWMDTQGRTYSTAAWQLLLGSLPLLALSTVVERTFPIHWTATFASILLFLALVGTTLAFALWYRLLDQAEVGQLSLYLFLVPVLGFLIALIFLGERLGWIEWAGVLVILLGIGIVLRDAQQRASSQPIISLDSAETQQSVR